MKCEIVEALMPSYLDKSCSEEIRRMMDEHIENCPNCAALLKEFELAEKAEAEKKVPEAVNAFKKVKRKHGMQLVSVVIISVLVFLLFGTRLNSEIMKVRFEFYLNRHFPDSELVLSDFEYQDPQSNGFGLNNGYYIAHVSSLKEEEIDMHFSVMTEGFFFRIKDNYEAAVGSKKETAERLRQNYNEDLDQVLREQLLGIYIESSVDIGCSEQYFEEEMEDQLTLHMAYQRNIDEVLPLRAQIVLACDADEIESVLAQLNQVLDQEDFDLNQIQIRLITETGEIEKTL